MTINFIGETFDKSSDGLWILVVLGYNKWAEVVSTWNATTKVVINFDLNHRWDQFSTVHELESKFFRAETVCAYFH